MRFAVKHLKRIAIGFLVTAATFLLSALVTFAGMMNRYREALKRGVPTGPPESHLPGGPRSMEDIVAALKEVPFKPVEPKAIGLARGALSLSFVSLFDMRRATAGYLYPYPVGFEEVTLESFDGAPLAAVAGIHRDGIPRPGLVISHGYMGSKNDHYILSVALKAFAEWGYNVIAPDLRDFGKSQRLSFNPTSFGWKEGEDLLAAAKYLGDMPDVTTVGVTGFSLGAVSTMRSAYMTREYPFLTGGAIAWNGASDGLRMIEHLDAKPAVTDDYYPFYFGFRFMHWMRREDLKRHPDSPQVKDLVSEPFSAYNFKGYLGGISAPHYGVSLEELMQHASSKEYLADVEVPLLIVHSADDPICPPREMEELIEIAGGKPNLAVWMTQTGMHCVYPYLDGNWFDAVLRRFFDYWADWG